MINTYWLDALHTPFKEQSSKKDRQSLHPHCTHNHAAERDQRHQSQLLLPHFLHSSDSMSHLSARLLLLFNRTNMLESGSLSSYIRAMCTLRVLLEMLQDPEDSCQPQ